MAVCPICLGTGNVPGEASLADHVPDRNELFRKAARVLGNMERKQRLDQVKKFAELKGYTLSRERIRHIIFEYDTYKPVKPLKRSGKISNLHKCQI